MVVIRKIKSIDTLSLRQEILRPRSNVSECLYEGDDDQCMSIHVLSVFLRIKK